ncbi:hypothetical protein GCM10010464_25190 [Pseudonocardia yunnanensis]
MQHSSNGPADQDSIHLPGDLLVAPVRVFARDGGLMGAQRQVTYHADGIPSTIWPANLMVMNPDGLHFANDDVWSLTRFPEILCHPIQKCPPNNANSE